MLSDIIKFYKIQIQNISNSVLNLVNHFIHFNNMWSNIGVTKELKSFLKVARSSIL